MCYFTVFSVDMKEIRKSFHIKFADDAKLKGVIIVNKLLYRVVCPDCCVQNARKQ